MLLSKEATSKDAQLKPQMFLSLADDESKSSEKIWNEFVFFGDQRAELTIMKANFPENCFVYIKQGQAPVVKGGEKTIYLDYVVLGQIMPAANADPSINFDIMSAKKMSLLFIVQFITNQLDYMVVSLKVGLCDTYSRLTREIFFLWVPKRKNSMFFSTMKTELPNIFSCTAFRKHFSYLLDQNQNQVKCSGMFLYLPSALDRVEDFLKYKDHVNLHPADLSIDDLKEIIGYEEINAALLENKDVRGSIVGGYYKIMKKIAEIFNQNLNRNSDAFISGGGIIDPENDFLWVNGPYKLSKERFQLIY